MPNETRNVYIGAVYLKSSGIYLIHNTRGRVKNIENQFIDIFRDAIGPIFHYGSGGTVSINGTDQLNISEGEYHHSTKHVSIPSNVAFEFDHYYHLNGDWTYDSPIVNVNYTQYDNGTNLAALTASYFTKHVLYVTDDGTSVKYFLVHGILNEATQNGAETGDNPPPPPFFDVSITPIAHIIVRQGTGIVSIIDVRRQVGATGSGGTEGVSDHSALQNLTADDHTQYLLTNGTRAMGGSLNMNTNTILNASTINGISITDHSTRHDPGGLDELTYAAPIATFTTASTNLVGSATSYSLSDHSHAFDTTTSPNGFVTLGTSQILSNKTFPSIVITGGISNALDITATDGSLVVSRLTTVQRDALTPSNGMIIYNTTTNEYNFYVSGSWQTITLAPTKSFCGMYISASTSHASLGTTPTIFTNLLWTSDSSQSFTSSILGRIQYTGSPKTFNIALSFASSASINKTYIASIGVGATGTSVAEEKVSSRQTKNITSSISSSTIQWTGTIATNDYIIAIHYVSGTGGTPTITWTKAYITITES